MKVTDKITITNEDNMELMARYPDNYFDLAIVDPPYGLGDSVVNSGGRFKKYHNDNGNWDTAIPSNEYFKELFRVSKNQIIWGGNYFELPKNKCFVIWDKQQPEDVSFAMCEYAWASFDKVSKIFKKRTQGQEDRFHPTQKPIYLYSFLLKHFAKENDKILDTHLGSGSIAIACHDYGFELTACELDKEYYDKAIQRIVNHTNQTKLF
jgi:site-specific DNA-methyltransferase (adenine-specific)